MDVAAGYRPAGAKLAAIVRQQQRAKIARTHKITCKSGAGIIQLALGVATASLYKTSIERAVIVSKVRSLIPSLPL